MAKMEKVKREGMENLRKIYDAKMVDFIIMSQNITLEISTKQTQRRKCFQIIFLDMWQLSLCISLKLRSVKQLKGKSESSK